MSFSRNWYSFSILSLSTLVFSSDIVVFWGRERVVERREGRSEKRVREWRREKEERIKVIFILSVCFLSMS